MLLPLFRTDATVTSRASTPTIDAIEAQSRFLNPGRSPRVWIGESASTASSGVIVNDNFFPAISSSEAIGIGERCRKNVTLKDNVFAQ